MSGNVTRLRILCAYVQDGLRPETEAALKQWAPDRVDWRAVSPDDDRAYGKLVEQYWRKQEDWAIIEQDIVVREDVIYEFDNCPHAWCAYPYAWTTNVGVALGCNRFRKEMMERFPNAASEAQGVSWRQFDVVFIRHILAQKYGIQPHIHLPSVEHLNEAKKLLPGADPFPMMHVPTDIGNLR